MESGVPMHIKPNAEVMVIARQLKAFEVYCPAKGWVMVEGLECRGAVDISASRDYSKVMARSPELKFTHAKTAGHYVARAKVDPGLYFIGVESHAEASESLAILRYSMFSQASFPYDAFDVEGEPTIRYTLEEDGGVTFVVNKLAQNGHEFRVLKSTYRLYLSSDTEKVREAAQCHSVEIYNRTVVLDQGFNPSQLSIRVEVPRP